MNPLRRLVLSSAALTPLGCATATFDKGIPVAAPKQMPMVRQPQIGQQWTYLKRDAFTSKVTDVITERVEIVGQRITIARSNQVGSTLASEVQGPWGSIITDPHWGRTINFGPAIPLWPEQMQANWNKQVFSRYSIDGNKYDCIRHEVLWFAPEIGRWVARESSGSYMVGGVGAVYLEGSHVWQLSAWK